MLLEVKFTDFNHVTNFLNSFDRKRNFLDIENANDLSQLKVIESIGNLTSYEANLQVKKEQTHEKKSIAFQRNNEDSDLDEDEIVLLPKTTKKLKKFKKMTVLHKALKIQPQSNTLM